ncbi:Cyn operon transcriptional activator [Streptomyces sp. MA5143a]|nr:Cyn operon transcriptional activator [Streptomyces sp. MA5143a]
MNGPEIRAHSAAVRTEQLEYLAAVTRLGSLRRAAEELRLSQPALSETVRNLERELGVDLLERRGVLTHRPLVDDRTRVLLMLQRRRAESVPRAARELHEAFVRRARELGARTEA